MSLGNKKIIGYNLTSLLGNTGLHSSIKSDLKVGSDPIIEYGNSIYCISKVNESDFEFSCQSFTSQLLIVKENDSVVVKDTDEITREEVEIQHPDDSSFIKIIHGEDLVRGLVDSSDAWADNGTQVVTQDFIPVKTGDEVMINFKSPNGGVIVYYVVYNLSKVRIDRTSWTTNPNTNGGGGNNYKITQDGYIKVGMTKAGQETITSQEQIDYYDGAVSILRFGKARNFDCALLEKENSISKTKKRIVLTKELLQQGAWDYVDSAYKKISGSNRVRNCYEMKVHKGDIICVTDTSYKFIASVSNDSGVKVFGLSVVKPAVCIGSDGWLHLSVRNTSNSDITPSDVADKIIIYPASENDEAVFTTDVDCVKFGAFNASDDIDYNANRVSNFKPIPANKGDVVFVNIAGLMMTVREVDRDTYSRVTGVSDYFTSIKSVATVKYGVYVVQNDNVLLNCTLAPTSGSLSDDITDYADCIKIFRVSSKDFAMLDRIVNKVTPLSSRKGRLIPSSELLYMQDGAFVGDKLWVSVDDYGGSESIKVIDTSDGTVVKTISHDFGHNGIADYCEENDTMLNVIPGDDKIYLLPNVSSVTTSIAKADCLQIDLNSLFGILGSGNCGCFGENKQTLYICKGYQLVTNTNVNKVYKIWLEVDANGDYTGNATLLNTYDFSVDGIDADYGTVGQLLSAQSCKYDGYLYLAYGTGGHNFFVLDVDDATNTCKVRGRIPYDYKIADGTKKYLEPEFIALAKGKIVTGSRNHSQGLSCIVEFEKW